MAEFDPFKDAGAVAVANEPFDPFKHAGAIPVDNHKEFDPFKAGAVPVNAQLTNSELEDFFSSPGMGTGQLDKYLEKADPTMRQYTGAGAIGELYALDNPTIKSGEDFRAAYQAPIIPIPKPENKGFFSGALRGAANLVEGVETPENAILMATIGAAPAPLQKVAGVGFTGMMLKNSIEKGKEIFQNHDSMTVGEIAEKSVEALGEAGMAALGAKHTFGRPGAGGSLPAERTGGATQAALDAGGQQNALRIAARGQDAQGNLLPEKIEGREVQPVTPETAESLTLSKAKLKENFDQQTPEVQQERQASIDHIDEQLLRMDRNTVAEAEKAVRDRGMAPPVQEPPSPSVPSEELPPPTESAGPIPPETPPSEEPTTPVKPEEIDPVMAKAAQESAERIADQVTQGQPTAVREAARDAAMDNAMSSMKNGKPPNTQFMRQSAKEAAGRAAERQGVSLDAPQGESEQTKLDTTPTPAPRAENKELLSAMDKAIGEALPERDAKILNGFKEGKTLDEIAAEHGLSGARVGQIVKAALPKLRKALEDAGFTEEDYAGGPGAMGPVEKLEMKLRQAQTTGLKRAVVDTERLSRGAEPIPTVERQREEGVVRDAEDLASSDPTTTPSLISRIVDKGETAITEKEAALLLVERTRLMNERAAWEERLGDKDQTETARTRLQEIENETNRLDIAQRTAGSTWGRLGHMYQRLLRDDYTLEAMERKVRAAKQGPLSPEEKTKLKEQSEKITELQKQLDETRAATEQKTQDTEVSRMVEATLNELGKDYLKKPTYGKQVFDIARGIVDRWKSEAETAKTDLRKALGLHLAGIPNPAVVLHVAKILRAKVGEFGLNKAEAFAEMLTEFGPKVKPHLERAWTQMGKLIHSEEATEKVKEVARKGISKKGEPTPVEAGAQAKAEAVAGEPLSHKTVFDTVKAVINSGIHGEDAIMAEAHKILKDSFHKLTERDVRRAYSEYGKVAFPSKEAVATEMRELRTLTRLQESIDRIQKDALDPLKSGPQRDKASQLVREKQAQLNELLKKREGAPSPEKLASRDEAKQTALRNQIEDLDKQLRTGEKPPGKTPSAPDSPATEQLRAERDAMQAKLDEIEDAANPKLSPEERYNRDRLKAVNKRIGELEAKIKAGDFTKSPKRVPPAANKELLAAQVKLAKVKQQIDAGIERERLKNRTNSQKFWDHFVGVERAMKLSSDVVLAKLGMAAGAREFALTPGEEAVGGVISKVLPGLAARAPREGGLNIRAEAKAKTAMFTEGMKDAWENMKMNSSDLEMLHGKERNLDPSWYDYFGFLHGAIKAPVKRAEFARSIEKRMDHFIRNGGDVNNVDAVGKIAQEAYLDGQRAIFMQDNVLSHGFNMFVRSMENSKNFPTGGPGFARLFKFLVPIVKVPTNIVGESLTGVHGTVTGAYQAGRAYWKGINKLPPEEADLILRNLKKGLIGNAFLLTGYFAYKGVGGFYQDREKRSESDVQPEHYKVGGVDLPGFVSHTNAAILMNAGATMRRQQEKGKNPVSAGLTGVTGIARQLPFIPATTKGIEAFKSGEGLEKYLASMLVDSTVPAVTSHAAKVIDTPGTFPKNAFTHPNKRYPKTVGERYKEKIPGLRQTVPGHR